MDQLAKIFLEDFLKKEELRVEKAAILLSMATNRENEKILKEYLTTQGFSCAVTEISGKASEVSQKMFHHILGAALNLGVVEKSAPHVHALVHATHEACVGVNFDTWLNTNYLLKVVIVRKDPWIAIVFNGFAATHPTSNHYRIGLGAMHI